MIEMKDGKKILTTPITDEDLADDEEDIDWDKLKEVRFNVGL